MDGDDELFGPRPSAPLPSQTSQGPTAPPAATDVWAVPRAVGALLCALGRPTDAELARANAGLARLSLPLLTARELVQATPESLAPLVPVEARAGVLALMRQIAGRSADPRASGSLVRAAVGARRGCGDERRHRRADRRRGGRALARRQLAVACDRAREPAARPRARRRAVP